MPHSASHGNNSTRVQSVFARTAAGDVTVILVLAKRRDQATPRDSATRHREQPVGPPDVGPARGSGESHASAGLARAEDNTGHAELNGRPAVSTRRARLPVRTEQGLITGKAGHNDAHLCPKHLAGLKNTGQSPPFADAGDTQGFADPVPTYEALNVLAGATYSPHSQKCLM